MINDIWFRIIKNIDENDALSWFSIFSGLGFCPRKLTQWIYRSNRGSIVTLEHHAVSCAKQNQVISKFRLWSQNKYTNYDYLCCPLQGVGDCKVQENFTPYASYGNGSLSYLVPHEVSCETTGFIHGFQLEKDSAKGMIRYKYSCCNLNPPWDSKLSCYTTETAMTSYGDAQVFNLRSQVVKCNPDHALSSFKFKVNESKTKISYQIRCCKVNS